MDSDSLSSRYAASASRPDLRLLNSVGWFRRLGFTLLRVPRPVSFLFAAAWIGLIWWTSSKGPPPAPRSYSWRAVVGNFLHVPAYGFLAVLLVATLPRTGAWPRPGWAARLWVVGTVFAYGIVDEWHQSHVPGRDLSVLDLATNVTAASVVVWIVSYLSRREATERGLGRRFAFGMALCSICALCATYLPMFWPDTAWL